MGLSIVPSALGPFEECLSGDVMELHYRYSLIDFQNGHLFFERSLV